MENKGNGKPVFCGKDGKCKDDLEKRLPTDDEIDRLYIQVIPKQVNFRLH